MSWVFQPGELGCACRAVDACETGGQELLKVLALCS